MAMIDAGAQCSSGKTAALPVSRRRIFVASSQSLQVGAVVEMHLMACRRAAPAVP
jgi:hypothetical protein